MKWNEKIGEKVKKMQRYKIKRRRESAYSAQLGGKKCFGAARVSLCEGGGPGSPAEERRGVLSPPLSRSFSLKTSEGPYISTQGDSETSP